MNAGYGIAVIAGLMQLQDAPDATNVVAALGPYTPDSIYAGVVVVEESMTYVAGLDWKVGKRWGAAAEYRHWPASIKFANDSYDAVTHAAGGYLYRELPSWGSLTLRTDAGGSVVWMDSKLDTSTTWAIGIRAAGRVRLSDRISVIMWTGSLRTGSSTATAGNRRGHRGRMVLSETGVALRIGIGMRGER